MGTIEAKSKIQEIHELLENVRDEKVPRRLAHIYQQVPANNCQRCADCCFSCAQVHPIEFLNIYDLILTLPELTRSRLAKRLVECELLNVTTLEYKCPFLEEKDCLVYERRPLQCRVVGLYPKEEYKRMVDESRDKNVQLAMYYARNERILLPQEVMEYDIEQCTNNVDEKGNAVVIGKSERQHMHAQVYSLAESTLEDEWISVDQTSFSTQFASLFFSSDELQQLRVKVIKEYQSGGKRTSLDKALSGAGLKF